MGGGVDPARHPADDDEPGAGEQVAELLGDLEAVASSARREPTMVTAVFLPSPLTRPASPIPCSARPVRSPRSSSGAG